MTTVSNGRADVLSQML